MPAELQFLIDAAAARQDYLWFLAITAWIGVVTMVVRLPAPESVRRLRPWLIGAACSGLAVAAIEMWLGVSPSPSGARAHRPGVDALLVITSSCGVAALVWAALPANARRRWMWRAGALGLLAVAVGVRIWAPTQAQVWFHGNLFERGPAPFFGAAALAVVQCSLIGWAIRNWRLSGQFNSAPRDVLVWVQVALGLAALQTIVCSFGPIAEQMGWSRRWSANALSPLGFPSAVIQVGLAISSLLVWWRWLGAPVVRSNPLWPRQRRWLAGAMAIWLSLGFVLAEWAGLGARRSFEGNMLGIARMAALLLNPGEIATCLGPDLRLGQPTTLRINTSAQPVQAFRVPFATEPVFEGMRRKLATIASEAKGFSPSISTLRDGFMVRVVVPPQPGLSRDLVAATTASADDLRAWDSRTVRLIPPTGISGGLRMSVHVPLRDADGRMLGWFDLRGGAAFWAASQAQARLLTFAVVAVGLVLALLVAVQRWHGLRHEESRRFAIEAEAATRAKTDFLAKVSHELRTPAQSILGFAQLMENSSLSSGQRTWLKSLQSQTDLMVRLVSDLLDLSALQLGTFRLQNEPTALAPVITEVATSLRPAAERKGLVLSVSVEPSLPLLVLTDGPRLRQVLLNLIGNAVKFTQVGHIEVQARSLPDLPSPPEMVWCEIVVSDSGPGIRPDDQLRLFQPFTRLAAAAGIEGSGLGLSVTAALVRGMGGIVGIESDGYSGSTFRVRWLLRTVADATTALHPSEGPSLAGRQILVADDNPVIRELLQTFFGSLGAAVVAVADGESALAESRGRTFDAVILDVSLPGRDGLAVAQALQTMPCSGARPRLVALSAYADVEARARALSVGIDAFFTKPADLRAVAAAIVGTQVSFPAAPTDLPPELARRFSEQFALEFPQQFSELRRAIEAGEWAHVSRAAHYLAGSAAVLRLDELRMACAELERIAAPGAERVALDACERIRVLGYGFVSPAINQSNQQNQSTHVLRSTR